MGNNIFLFFFFSFLCFLFFFFLRIKGTWDTEWYRSDMVLGQFQTKRPKSSAFWFTAAEVRQAARINLHYIIKSSVLLNFTVTAPIYPLAQMFLISSFLSTHNKIFKGLEPICSGLKEKTVMHSENMIRTSGRWIRYKRTAQIIQFSLSALTNSLSSVRPLCVQAVDS